MQLSGHIAPHGVTGKRERNRSLCTKRKHRANPFLSNQSSAVSASIDAKKGENAACGP